jgi:predicted Zn-dependent peptidase
MSGVQRRRNRCSSPAEILTSTSEMHFTHTELPNGLNLVSEANPRAQSVALGFFVRTGSRDETPEVAGVSHFLEHMAFKGDEKYSAADVNRVFDELGANSNASTSEENTIYYAAVLPESLEPTLDLLSSLIRPSLRQADFDVEKQVIIEEIGMYDDQPSYAVYEQAMQTYFSAHPLGQSVLGTRESIEALTSEQMRAYHAQRYGAENITLAVAGAFDPQELERLVEARCGAWPRGNSSRILSRPAPVPLTRWTTKPTIHQQHIIGMSPAPDATDPLRFAAEMLSVIVGEEGSGRLYWELVETGQAETADLGYNEFEGHGAWMTYLCCEPDVVDENLETVLAVFKDVIRSGISETELEQARNKVASRAVLRSERPMGRMSSLGNDWLYRREYRSVQDDLQQVRGVTVRDIQQLVEAFPLKIVTQVGLGPKEA